MTNNIMNELIVWKVVVGRNCKTREMEMILLYENGTWEKLFNFTRYTPYAASLSENPKLIGKTRDEFRHHVESLCYNGIIIGIFCDENAVKRV